MMYHFKMNDDVNLYPAVLAFCQENFSGRWLVVRHLGNHNNPHLHVQGTIAEGKEQKKLYSICHHQIAPKHIQRNIELGGSKGKRVMKVSDGVVDDIGFQYMLKEKNYNVIFQNGFTPEDIDDLHDLSVQHCAKLKAALWDQYQSAEWMHHDGCACAHLNPQSFHLFLNTWLLHGFKYYADTSTLTPPNFKKLVLNYMGRMHPELRTHIVHLL